MFWKNFNKYNRTFLAESRLTIFAHSCLNLWLRAWESTPRLAIVPITRRPIWEWTIFFKRRRMVIRLFYISLQVEHLSWCSYSFKCQNEISIIKNIHLESIIIKLKIKLQLRKPLLQFWKFVHQVNFDKTEEE